EKGAQLVAAPKACPHVVRGSEECVYARVFAPGGACQQNRLQPFAPDFSQVRDALANGLLELLLIAGVQPAARLDGLHHQLEDIRDQLTLGRVIRGSVPASEESGRYAFEKRGSHCLRKLNYQSMSGTHARSSRP